MRLGALCFVCLLSVGCKTASELPQVDLSQPGWRVRQGQAIWKSNRDAPELSGELVWATHRDGQFLLQFLKTPITLVDAQGDDERWRISFPPEGRTFAGRRSSRAADRFAWLYLARALRGEKPAGDWAFFKHGERWALGSARTGEMIEGYFGQ